MTTSSLGFGCVGLTVHPDRADALVMLGRALDLGITHFDTARIYGYGESEAILGRFLVGRRDRVTVATKFGLEPNATLAKHRRLVGFARWAGRRVPGFRRVVGRMRSAASTAAAATVGDGGGLFTPAAAARSLEDSLRSLGTDYVDLLLLHECQLADAASDDLIAFLRDRVDRGQVRAFGVATDASKLGGDVGRFPPAYPVYQFAHGVAEPNLDRVAGLADKGVLVHSALRGLGRLVEAARRRPDLAAAHAAAVGCDLRDPAAVSATMFRAVAGANPDGVLLFSTTRRPHLEANAKAWDRPAATADQRAAFVRFAAEAIGDAKAGSL